MNTKPSLSYWARQSLVVTLTLATVVCAYLPIQGAQEDAKFVAVEKDGSKVWEGGGTIDLKARGSRPLTLKVVNTLTAEHGFAIDTMKVKEVIKPGEEKTITVPLANIDTMVSEHRVYCHLHPKHVAATLKVTGR
ncbi:MAG: hypothetical protein ACREI2_06535 [Nitrospiraceae bacterium]